MPTTVPLSGGEAEVHYERSGDGPGLVLVHGTAARPRSRAWRARCSPSPSTPVSLPSISRAIRWARSSPRTSPPRARKKVLSLVMHAGWVRTDTRMAAEFRSWIATLRADAEHGTTLFARLLPLMAFGPGYWTATTDEANEALVEQLIAVVEPGAIRHTEVDLRVDLGPLLDRITAPALVLASAHDRLIDAAQQRELVSRIAGARYAELEAGHGAPAEVPDAFGEALASFSDSQRLAAASAR